MTWADGIRLDKSHTLKCSLKRGSMQIRVKRGSMQIRVKPLAKLTPQSIELDVGGGDTVAETKAAIHALHGVPAKEQRLTFAGEQLQDDWTLERCRLEQGSLVHLVIRGKQTKVHFSSWGKTKEKKKRHCAVCTLPLLKSNGFKCRKVHGSAHKKCASAHGRQSPAASFRVHASRQYPSDDDARVREWLLALRRTHPDKPYPPAIEDAASWRREALERSVEELRHQVRGTLEPPDEAVVKQEPQTARPTPRNRHKQTLAPRSMLALRS